MSYVDFYTFLMPLYALSLGFGAAEVGVLVGACSVPHGDRLARSVRPEIPHTPRHPIQRLDLFRFRLT